MPDFRDMHAFLPSKYEEGVAGEQEDQVSVT